MKAVFVHAVTRSRDDGRHDHELHQVLDERDEVLVVVPAFAEESGDLLSVEPIEAYRHHEHHRAGSNDPHKCPCEKTQGKKVHPATTTTRSGEDRPEVKGGSPSLLR